jgi:hypothetical protein
MHIVTIDDALTQTQDSRTFDSIMKPRPSISTALNMDNIRYSPSKNGEFTNRSLAKSVYGTGFHTTKNRDIKLNMDSSARRSVIEFPKHNETPQGISSKQIPFFGGSKFTSSYSNWNFK